MDNKEKLILATGLSLLFIAIFLGISEWINLLSLDSVPAFARPIVNIVMKFFTYAPVTFAVAYMRNISGFIRNWFNLHKTQTVTYDLERYNGTVLYYMGAFNIALAVLPPPFNALGAALTFIIDIYISEYKKITIPIPVPVATKSG